MSPFWRAVLLGVNWRWHAVLMGIAGCIGLYVHLVGRPFWIAWVAAFALAFVPTPEWAKAKPDDSEEHE
jgi:hypothetical protein